MMHPDKRYNFNRTLLAAVMIFGAIVFAFAAQPPSEPKVTTLEMQNAFEPVRTKIEVLDTKLALLQATNEKILQSVYWTIGVFAAIFLGLISVNLYFNISANKAELAKIREGVENLAQSLIVTANSEITEKMVATVQVEIGRVKDEIANLTTSSIKTSELTLTDKIVEYTRREIEKAIHTSVEAATKEAAQRNGVAILAESARLRDEIANLTSSQIKTSESDVFEKIGQNMRREIDAASVAVSAEFRNQLLSQRAEIGKDQEKMSANMASMLGSIKAIENRLKSFALTLKELETYRYAQLGRMGAIMGHVELLDHDLDNRRWNLKYRLPDILKEVQHARLPKELAERLKGQLEKIKEPEHEDIVGKIQQSISISDSEKKSG